MHGDKKTPARTACINMYIMIRASHLSQLIGRFIRLLSPQKTTKAGLESDVFVYFVLPPDLNTPDARRPVEGANTFATTSRGGTSQTLIRAYLAAGTGSRLPTHPDSWSFAASDLDSPRVPRPPVCCSSVAMRHSDAETDHPRRTAVAPGEGFVQGLAAAVVGGRGCSTEVDPWVYQTVLRYGLPSAFSDIVISQQLDFDYFIF